MKIENTTIQALKNKESKLCNAAAVLGGIAVICLTSLIMCAGHATLACVMLCTAFACGIAAMSLAILRSKILLKELGLKSGQTVYLVVYHSLKVREVQIESINMFYGDRFIVTSYDTYVPYKNLYLTKEDAEKALSEFTSNLYSDVSQYLKITAPLSRSQKTEIEDSYKEYVRCCAFKACDFKIEDMIAYAAKKNKERQDEEFEKQALIGLYRAKFLG